MSSSTNTYFVNLSGISKRDFVKDQHMFGELKVDGTRSIEIAVVISQCVPVHGRRHERVMILSLLDIDVVDCIRLQVLREESIRRSNEGT